MEVRGGGEMSMLFRLLSGVNIQEQDYFEAGAERRDFGGGCCGEE